MRLSLRPIFLQPGRSLTRLSCQHLGAVLEDVPVQSFSSKAGATFRLKDGALAYARVRRLFVSPGFTPRRTLGIRGSLFVSFILCISFLFLNIPKCGGLYIGIRRMFVLLEFFRINLTSFDTGLMVGTRVC